MKQKILKNYEPQRQTRTIDVYCVSNKLYREASDLQETNNCRRSSNEARTNDKVSAANQMRQSSGIPELRDFIKGIPSKSQIAETRHFLKTRLLSLLEKTNLWLNASVPGVAANQPAAPEFVQGLRDGLKTVGLLWLFNK